MLKPFIANVSAPTIALGWHRPADVLIQIGRIKPRPAQHFYHVHKFQFSASRISNRDAARLRQILRKAYSLGDSVVVQCLCGVQRSGAVVDYAKTLGFTDAGGFRLSARKIYQRLIGTPQHD